MWIEQYIEMKYQKNSKEIKLEEAMELKYNHIPSSLYKYRGYSEYSVQNLKNDSVWFNSADKLNDPYDSALVMRTEQYMKRRIALATFEDLPNFVHKHGIEISEEELNTLKREGIEDIFRTILRRVPDYTEEIIEQLIESVFGVMKDLEESYTLEKVRKSREMTFLSCFSEINDSMLMWSHYADSHKGFCLEYNFKKPGRDSILTRALNPVIYREELLDVSEYLLDGTKYGLEFNNLVSTYWTMIKSLDWAYEKEWRMIFPFLKAKASIVRFLSRKQSI